MRAHQALAPLCHSEIAQLVHRHRGIESAAVSSGDGFEVASVLRPGIPAEKLAAMASSLQALSEAVAQELGMHHCRNVIVETEAGSVVTLRIPTPRRELLMTVLCSDASTLGTVLYASREAARALAGRLAIED